MKKILAVFGVCLLLCACQQSPVEKKLIVSKISRVVGCNGNTHTEYLLIAEDDSFAKTSIVTYSKAVPGETVIESNGWIRE